MSIEDREIKRMKSEDNLMLTAKRDIEAFRKGEVQDVDSLIKLKERVIGYMHYAGTIESHYEEERKLLEYSMEEQKVEVFLAYRKDGTAEKTSDMQAKKASLFHLKAIAESNKRYKDFRNLKETLRDIGQHLSQRISWEKQQFSANQFIGGE